MSITVERTRIDAQKIEVVTYTDKFGSVHKVQHSLAELTRPGYDKAAVEAEAMTMMEANEVAWEQQVSGGGE